MSHTVIYEFCHKDSGDELSECKQFKLALDKIDITISFYFVDNVRRCKIEGDNVEHVNWTLVKLELIDTELERLKNQAMEAGEQTHPIRVMANQRAQMVCHEADDRAAKIKENAINKADFIRKEGDRKVEKLDVQASGEADKIEGKYSEKAAHLQDKDLYGCEAERVRERGHREAFKVRRKAAYEVDRVKQQVKRDVDKTVERAKYEVTKVKEEAKEEAYWIKEKAIDKCQEIKDKAIKRRERVIQDVIDEIHQDSKKFDFFSL